MHACTSANRHLDIHVSRIAGPVHTLIIKSHVLSNHMNHADMQMEIDHKGIIAAK